MAFLNVNTPLKNLKTGDYFYPLTNLDQIITGDNRLSAFMNEDSSNHNLLNLSNIGNLSVNTINVNGLTVSGNTTLNNGLTVSGNTTLNNGNFYFNSNTGTYKFYITRSGGTDESTGIWADDSYTHFDVMNDETTANVQFKLQATDTESGGGAGAQTSYVNFYGRNGKSTINANCFGVNGDNTDYSLYVNGTSYFTNGVAIINDSSNTNYDSLFYVRNYSNSDWSIKIAKSTYSYGLYVEGTGADLLRIGTNNTLNVGNASVQISGTALKITNNGNTFTVGSLNNSYCHFQNSVNIPFYFNKNVYIDGQMIQYPSAVISQSWIDGRDSAAVRVAKFNNYHAGLSMKTSNGSWEIGVYTNNNLWFVYASDSNYNNGTNSVNQTHIDSSARIWGAVWNDYAEMRNVPIANDYKSDGTHSLYAGRCVYENGDDTMSLTFERLQKGCKIISDTFGFNIGETENCKTPVAVSGRVLAYIYEGREAAKNAIGKPVCSGPNGTVSIMTDEEYRNKGYCCIGIISAVPDYKVWGTSNVKVDGRIWIYVR